MSKINYNSKNKLSYAESPNEQRKGQFEIPDKIQMSTKPKTRVTSFSLRSNDQDRFRLLLTRTQSQMTKKITSTDILRGLLIFGESLETESLVECVQKTFLA